MHAGGFAPSASGFGGPGNDLITFAGSLSGIAGIELSGGPGADSLGGGPFADTVHGGSGNDTIDVRGSGNDTIDVRGGGSDTVTCGSGHDVVRHDTADTIAADCERALPAP